MCVYVCSSEKKYALKKNNLNFASFAVSCQKFLSEYKSVVHGEWEPHSPGYRAVTVLVYLPL